MTRDLLIQYLVGLDAQLRRIERLSANIGSAEEHKARIPPLVEDASRSVQRIASRLEQQEEKA